MGAAGGVAAQDPAVVPDTVPPAAEAPPADSVEESSLEVSLGGALRLNYAWQNYNDARKDRVGDFGFEVFIASAEVEYEDLFLSVQHRWYADFEAIRYGYFGFRFSPELEAHLGIHQVPFGILPWASHSFWFGATYYMGFEDDYDAGVKLVYRDGPLSLDAAFYKNPEYIDSSRFGRYSFDMVTEGEQANEEINQANLRAAYDWNLGSDAVLNFGASFEYGQIYNTTTTEKGDRHAYAVHSDLKAADWNVQLQWIGYDFNPRNPPGVDRSTVQMGAFAFPFLMASEGGVGTFNVAKDFLVGARFLESIKCYADLSKVFPNGDDTHTSTQIVTGCLLAKGGFNAYVDWITGQNMWFAGGPGIGLGGPEADDWNGRLNVNIAFYF